MAKKYLFRIWRFDPENDDFPYFQDYVYEENKPRVILEALMDIRNEQDSTLAFRYSCREAVCGSCGMVINGEFELACRTRLDSLGSETIIIEPLPNLPIQKDLVVDMEPFWKALEAIQPYVMSEGQNKPTEGISYAALGEPSTLTDEVFRGSPAGEKKETGKLEIEEKSIAAAETVIPSGYRIEEREMEKIEPFTNCILCGCCYSACPVVSRDENYLGPIALAKLYRFICDPRDQRPFTAWERFGSSSGVWGCDTVFRCNEVCPREVGPAYGILALRRRYFWEKIKHIFRKEK